MTASPTKEPFMKMETIILAKSKMVANMGKESLCSMMALFVKETGLMGGLRIRKRSRMKRRSMNMRSLRMSKKRWKMNLKNIIYDEKKRFIY